MLQGREGRPVAIIGEACGSRCQLGSSSQLGIQGASNPQKEIEAWAVAQGVTVFLVQKTKNNTASRETRNRTWYFGTSVDQERRAAVVES